MTARVQGLAHGLESHPSGSRRQALFGRAAGGVQGSAFHAHGEGGPPQAVDEVHGPIAAAHRYHGGFLAESPAGCDSRRLAEGHASFIPAETYTGTATRESTLELAGT